MWTLANIKESLEFESVSLGELRNYCEYILDDIQLSNYIDTVPENLKQKTHNHYCADDYTRIAISLWYLGVPIILFDIEYKGCNYDNLTINQKTTFNPEMYKEMCKQIEMLALLDKWR
jgi:hypothetical protein